MSGAQEKFSVSTAVGRASRSLLDSPRSQPPTSLDQDLGQASDRRPGRDQVPASWNSPGSFVSSMVELTDAEPVEVMSTDRQLLAWGPADPVKKTARKVADLPQKINAMGDQIRQKAKRDVAKDFMAKLNKMAADQAELHSEQMAAQDKKYSQLQTAQEETAKTVEGLTQKMTLQEKKHQREVADLNLQISNLHKELYGAKSSNAPLLGEVNATKAQVARLEKELLATQESLRRSKEDKAALNDQLVALTTKVAALVTKAKVADGITFRALVDKFRHFLNGKYLEYLNEKVTALVKTEWQDQINAMLSNQAFMQSLAATTTDPQSSVTSTVRLTPALVCITAYGKGTLMDDLNSVAHEVTRDTMMDAIQNPAEELEFSKQKLYLSMLKFVFPPTS